MSDLRAVMQRAQTDYDFYLAVLGNPERALASYDLSQAERDAFTSDRPALWRVGRPPRISLGSDQIWG
jgi:hypothetical protein